MQLICGALEIFFSKQTYHSCQKASISLFRTIPNLLKPTFSFPAFGCPSPV
jgi:hypothetical protein